ncbi:MAG: hypothetical protein GF409_02555 [Candidatus Omnitrophica bacterium]|nr:hypothetical protein [Candidatus Omnitrophota bacterium]
MRSITVLVMAGSLLFGALALSGCDAEELTVRYVVARYLGATINGRHEEAYRYISSKDKQIKSLEQTVPEQRWEKGTLKSYLLRYTRYTIGNINIEGDNASVSFTITSPDYRLISMDIPQFDLTKAPREGEYGKRMVKLLKDTYGGDLPQIVRSQRIDLVKEDGTWRVFLNWEEEREKEAQQKEEMEKLLLEESKKHKERQAREEALREKVEKDKQRLLEEQKQLRQTGSDEL